MNQAEGGKLEKAARAGDMKIIQQLLSKIDVKQPADKDWLGRSLAQAVFGRSIEAVELLLKAGGNPNQDISVGTLLSYPASNGDLHIVKKLIEGGANCNREFKRETALSAALEHSQTSVIEYLEKSGAYSPPDTTLFFACANGDIKRAKEALDSGANVEKTGGTFGETPLMVAARKGQVEAVQLLLKHKADPNKQIKGQVALYEAVKYGKNLEVFELLVAAGANIHAKYYDETLLMTAAHAGCLPIVKRLAELGLAVSAQNNNFWATALDIARTHKHKEIVAYLTSLGARAGRDAAHVLMAALAREFGGRPAEYSHGIKLNSKLAGNKCEFHIFQDVSSATVFKLNYTDKEFRRAARPGVIIGRGMSKGPQVEVKSAGKILDRKVMRPPDSTGVTDEFVTEFCRRHKEFFKQLNLAGQESVGITSDVVRFWWTGSGSATILPRLKLFANFVQEIARPAEPERCLFESQWLFKPAPKTSDAKSGAAHTLGGALEKSVTCPHCGLATNLMAQIDLSDPALSKTPLGSGKLPVFLCLGCLEWDPAFFDISRPIATAIDPKGKVVKAGKETGEEDLPERRVLLAPVVAGKKAGRISKIGGAPTWIQAESTPDCPNCKKPMAFVLQLASDRHISYCDLGMLYAFACPDCKVSASLIQSH